jgi:nucleoside-diphosphate-sugar epimerase
VTDPTTRTVAITGATGYLGGVIRSHFEAAGWRTVDLVRTPRNDHSRRYLLTENPASDLLDEIDALVHCAYDMTVRNRSDIWRINVEGSQKLLELAHRSGVPRTIVLSSMSAYAGTNQLYGLSKLDIESRARDLGATSVRPGLVYGPNAGGMAGAMTKLTRLPIVPVVAARSTQFTVHEHDFAVAIEALVRSDVVFSEPIGIANPDPVPFRRVVEGLARQQGRTCRTLAVSWRLAQFGLQACERFDIELPFRSDSLLGLARPAPFVPNLEVLDDLGISLRRFGQPVPPENSSLDIRWGPERADRFR